MSIPKQFPLEYDEALIAIRDFKRKYSEGTITSPTIPEFLGEIGASTDEYWAVINNPKDKNRDLAVLLKKFATWTEGKMSARGDNIAKLYLLQGWSGYSWQDKQRIDTDTKMEINVNFSNKSKDPFG